MRPFVITLSVRAMLTESFSHVDYWVFDLDNTLYPPQARLFDQIEARMIRYVMDALSVNQTEAKHLCHRYWRDYGTTLAGLMREHGLKPGPYLNEVHDIDFGCLTPDTALAERIGTLPGRKIVYTNGCAPYAERVLNALDLSDLFDAIYGIEHADFQPKPEPKAFATIFAKDGLAPDRAAMFEDDPRNLKAPHEMGMCTVLVAPEPAAGDHIHHYTADLGAFLAQC